MALSGLEIYKLLPKTNCKDCGFPTCLAFAMQLAAKKTALDKCVHVGEASKQALEGASQPPVKLVTIGSGDGKLEIGNETVLFRHEETFRHPAGIGFLVEDTLSDKEFKEKIDKITKLSFQRVGQCINVDLIAIKNSSGDESRFLSKVKIIDQLKLSQPAGNIPILNIILMGGNSKTMSAALEVLKARRPLVYSANSKNYEAFGKLARDFNVPLVVSGDSLEEVAELTQKLKAAGVEEMVLDTGKKDLHAKITDLVNIRRLALKKAYRPLGYPAIVFTDEKDAFSEALSAASYISKYAGLVIMKNAESWAILPTLTARQDMYTDPQKPVQVEAKIYELGSVTKDSPVLITTNFSITYFTVAGETEASKMPSYIVACDCEGMSVLTAWAAEKFTPEKVVDTINKFGVSEKVSHKNIIIPGYVAMMSGKLEDLLPGWKIIVGPREAAGIPSFLKTISA